MEYSAYLDKASNQTRLDITVYSNCRSSCSFLFSDGYCKSDCVEDFTAFDFVTSLCSISYCTDGATFCNGNCYEHSSCPECCNGNVVKSSFNKVVDFYFTESIVISIYLCIIKMDKLFPCCELHLHWGLEGSKHGESHLRRTRCSVLNFKIAHNVCKRDRT